ncbi:hypothetical protein EV196_10510 [Mariniflexile fucanivorans]|uniref:Uncharacterized protein n=1 Tax=Mariniflexile fucanivorans TaxID=264023 RepID=A0A4R1RHE2_9FLAO|nr:hypothetical protein [Mariniflexile fucanivorans]TCL65356.1 hypothetical protein EV196_10510 [Mariniflexile fucanivorans]
MREGDKPRAVPDMLHQVIFHPDIKMAQISYDTLYINLQSTKINLTPDFQVLEWSSQTFYRLDKRKVVLIMSDNDIPKFMEGHNNIEIASRTRLTLHYRTAKFRSSNWVIFATITDIFRVRKGVDLTEPRFKMEKIKF